MSQLVFLANSGGSVTLTNADTASTIALTIPATNGTFLIQDSSGTLTVNNLTVTGTPSFTTTGQLYLPKGTTANRTSSPAVGLIRFNTDAGGFYEGYINTNWVKFTTTNEGSYTGTYFIAAGGGSGSGTSGAGGAGGYVINTFTIISGTTFSVIVGAGGAPDSNGNNSSITGLNTAIGGGNGASGSVAAGSGGSGGSGGAASGYTAAGSGTSGQGNAGGSGYGATLAAGGGGGGATAAGTAPAYDYVNNRGSGYGGNGGAGVAVTLTGASVTYCGGGAGGGNSGSGSAGAGGGGAGGNFAPAGSGGANTGGGGGGSYGSTGGSGGSGTVLIQVPTASYTGTTTGTPTVTTYSIYTIMKFTASGSYTG